jgi:cytochrome c peroxidase
LIELPKHTADAKRGETLFWTAGCASCHADGAAKGDERLKLGGGLAFKTDFGTFYAPNISPDPEHGIGTWCGARHRQRGEARHLAVGPALLSRPALHVL